VKSAPAATPPVAAPSTPRHLEHIECDAWIAAGADLSMIRAAVCRALRRGASPAELSAMLKAEEAAMERLAAALAVAGKDGAP
jgi:hypothetical protein